MNRQKTYDDVIKEFDSIIKKQYPKAKGIAYNCSAYIDKLLFIQSMELTIDDWREIRGDDYWEKTIDFSSIHHKKSLLNKILIYKKNKLN